MLIKAKGIIEFEPEDKTKKHLSQTSWKRIAMIRTHDDLCEYYSWFIKRRFNLELNKPLRGSHVTFINDAEREMPFFNESKALFDSKEITFYIDPEPRTNGEHWWLRVYCTDAESIRTVCGGNSIPFFAFHLTIGYATHLRLEHSKYILEVCKRHQIIPSDERQSFSSHKIIDFENC
jgi:hypothetical protein